MARSYLTIAGTIWHPRMPLSRERFFIGAEQEMQSGQLRRAVAATKKRHGPYVSPELTRAEVTALEAAITYAASFAFVDEDGVSRTAVLDSWVEDLVRNEPAVDSLTGTQAGENYYEITITLRDV